MGKRQKAEPQPGTFPFQQPGDITLTSKGATRERRKLPIEKALKNKNVSGRQMMYSAN